MEQSPIVIVIVMCSIPIRFNFTYKLFIYNNPASDFFRINKRFQKRYYFIDSLFKFNNIKYILVMHKEINISVENVQMYIVGSREKPQKPSNKLPTIIEQNTHIS